jgi:hypothetical protein
MSPHISCDEADKKGELELEAEGNPLSLFLIIGTRSTWNRTNDQNYIRATKPHSRIGFKFTTSLGTVQLQYLRSAIFGLGSVKCWVDEDEWMGVNVIGYWKEIVNIGRYVLLILSISYPPYL